MQNLKIKPLDKEQLIIALDRLTRFKDTETKYLRVFKEVIIHNLISPKYSKHELDRTPYENIKDLAQNIINFSIKNICGGQTDTDTTINDKIFKYENSVFNITTEGEILLENNINYKACFDLIHENSPKNLIWLKSLISSNDVIKQRETDSILFPIEKVILAEGATEETLLPVFSKICNYDFDKKGVFIISAGGKNQVVKIYYELSQALKLPIFVLLDKDGEENAQEIKPKLRPKDKIHIIQCGEFEDMLPIKLIQRTLYEELHNISQIEINKIEDYTSMVEYLEDVFKNRGMHEYKKVEFAQMIKNNIKTSQDLSPEIVDIIEGIKSM